MKKFLVTQELDYVQGHLKYGHRELYVYADSLEEAKKKFMDEHLERDMEIVIDDYSIYDWEGRGNPYAITEVNE